MQDNVKVIETSPLFKAEWYANRYPDVGESGIEPVLHYLNIGWKKGYWPGPEFDGDRYLDINPDVRKANINPLLHYEVSGRREGRRGSRTFKNIKPTLIDKFFCKFKSKNPKFSIIVASYNYAQYISQTLDSLISQTYKNFEVIIVDDSSSDNSIEIINDYLHRYNFIKLYQHIGKINRGLVETIKLGIKKSTGDYIAFCESDDYWTKNHLEEIVKIILRYGVVNIIATDIELVFSDSLNEEKFLNHRACICNLLDKSFISLRMRQLLKFNCIPTFSCVTVKKNILEKCNYNSPIDRWLDYWLWLQILKKNKLFILDNKLTCFRAHKGSYNFQVTRPSRDMNFFLQSFHSIRKFDPVKYLLFNQDIAAAGLDPFVHYINHGKKENRYAPLKTYNRIFYPKNFDKSQNSRKILLVSHDLSYTGAPIFLFNLAVLLQELGFCVYVVTPNKDMGLKARFLESNIPVWVNNDINTLIDEMLKLDFEFCFCNTILTITYYNILRKVLPTFWLIHDIVNDVYAHYILQLLGEDSCLYVPSKITKIPLEKYFNNILTFPYPVKDTEENLLPKSAGKKVRFAVLGSIIQRKGQDILLEAIELLDDNIKDQAEFIIRGKLATNKFSNCIKKKAKNLKCVKIYDSEKNLTKYFTFIKNIDILIMPSRNDPYPLVVIDALMCSCPVIVSDSVGQSDIISKEKSGLVFSNGNVEELAGILKWLVLNKQKLAEMRKNARATFEKNFKYSESVEYFRNLLCKR